MKKILLLLFVLFALVGCTPTEVPGEPEYVNVTFVVDGVTVRVETILVGKDATPPQDPEKPDYEFVEWDQGFTNVQEDLVIHAVFIPIKLSHTIYFYDGQELLFLQVVEDGESLTPPAAPDKDGYIFVGWDGEFGVIDSSRIYMAIYEKEEVPFTVVFKDGNTVLATRNVKRGESAIAPTPPQKDGHAFVRWSESFENVQGDLVVQAIYEEIKVTYEVVFMDGDVELSRQCVEKGGSATPPTPLEIEGTRFMGWSRSFDNIQNNMLVEAVRVSVEPESRIDYVSYVDSFTVTPASSPQSLLEAWSKESSLKSTITSVNNGGARGTNQIVYYNAANLRTRNIYGFEIAIDANGLAVDKSTLVDLPTGGFIISAHGTGIDKINKINVGDYVTYDVASTTVRVYYDASISGVIGLYITIEDLLVQVEAANASYKPLDYQAIQAKIEAATLLYNSLVTNYSSTKLQEAKDLLLDAAFLMVETSAIQVKAYWHYPLGSQHLYKENNVADIEKLLDGVRDMGFNLIYLNTNAAGRSVYKSKYLSQYRTNNANYAPYKDYLEAFIDQAHKRGISVSAWTNTLIAGDGSWNSSLYPDNTILKGINGENNQGGMYFVDISNPSIQILLENVMEELASYDLDGIEFDFIRYPSGNLRTKTGDLTGQTGLLDWGYTPTFIEAFRAEHPFTGDFKTRVLKEEVFRNQWLDFKEAYLTNMVERMVNAMRRSNPNIIVSAAVMSSRSGAKNTYLQDWYTWVENGWVDVLDPMIYNAETSYVVGQLQAMFDEVGSKAKIVAGLFPETNGGLISTTAEQIDAIINQFPVGWAKFSSKNILNNASLMHAFGQMNREYTVTPWVEESLLIRSVLYEMADHVENYYGLRESSFDFTSLLEVLNEAYANESPQGYMQDIRTQVQAISHNVIRNRLIGKLDALDFHLNRK